jgi:hypothetical protein
MEENYVYAPGIEGEGNLAIFPELSDSHSDLAILMLIFYN